MINVYYLQDLSYAQKIHNYTNEVYANFNSNPRTLPLTPLTPWKNPLLGSPKSKAGHRIS